jgi:hypothetical protein
MPGLPVPAGAVRVGCSSGRRVAVRAGGTSGEVMIPDGESDGMPPPSSNDDSVQFGSDDLEVVETSYPEKTPYLHDSLEVPIQCYLSDSNTEEFPDFTRRLRYVLFHASLYAQRGFLICWGMGIINLLVLGCMIFFSRMKLPA